MSNAIRTVSQQGDSFTDDVSFCRTCGWWEFVMREPWTATTHHGVLRRFPDDAIVRSVSGLLEMLASGGRDINTVSPRDFEKLAYAYFRDDVNGSVELTAATKDGGFDLYCVDSAIGPFIVEVKRYRDHVGIGVIRALLGVMVHGDISTGLVFTSSRLTKNSQEFVDAINGKGQWRMDARNIDDITAWLRVTWGDFDPDLLWNQIKGLSLNGDEFAIPREFFAGFQTL
jgi:hypothetical protein